MNKTWSLFQGAFGLVVEEHVLAGSLSFTGQLCWQEWSPERPESTQMEGQGTRTAALRSLCRKGSPWASESSGGAGLCVRN